MLLYSIPPVALPPGVWGFCAARAKTNGRKNAGSHGGEAMAATWYLLYFARETEHIEGRKYAVCALKLRSHTGHFLSSEMQSIAQASRTTRQQCSSELSHFRGIQVDPNHSDSKPRATMRSKW